MNALIRLYPGDAFAEFVGSVVVQITVLILLAALIARTVARRSAAARHCVWLCALAGSLLTPLAAGIVHRTGLRLVAVPVLNDRVATLPVAEDRPSVAGERKVIGEIEAPVRSVRIQPNGVAAGLPVGHSPAEPSLLPPDEGSHGVFADYLRAALALAIVVWLIGVVLGMLRLLHGWVTLVILRRGVEPLESDRLRDVLVDVREALGVASLPRIAGSQAVSSPVAAGVFRPLVLLPAGLAVALDRVQLRDVLVHECAHVMRRDHLIGLAQCVAGVILWPHPLVHYLNRQLARSREEICDNYVLRRASRTAYARTLLELSERLTPVPARISAFGILQPKWRLEDRVRGLLDGKRELVTRLRTRSVALVAVVFALTLVFVAGTRLVSADAPVDSTEKSQPKEIGTKESQQKSQAAVNQAIAQLKDPDAEVRRHAAKLLGELSPAAAVAIPSLIEALADEGPHVGREARLSLAKIGLPALPALTAALKHEDKTVRWWAAQALEELGPDAQSAIPALIASLGDTERPVNNSASTLAAIGTMTIPPLLDVLKNPASSPMARTGAAGALGAIGPRASVAVPDLIEALKDRRIPNAAQTARDWYPVCFAAAAALGAIGPDAKAAVPALIELLRDANPRGHQVAADAIGNIGPEAAMAVPALVPILRDKDQETATRAAMALGAIGPAARDSVPALIEHLARLDSESNDPYRERVIGALAGIGSESAPALVQAYRVADTDHKPRIIKALGAIGAQSDQVLPTLIAALDDRDSAVRLAALDAISPWSQLFSPYGVSPLGNYREAAVPAITKVLKDRDAEVREHAAGALFAVGPPAQAAVPALIEALADRNARVRREAAWALFAIGPQAKAAAPALREASRDADKEVRTAAAKALSKVQSNVADTDSGQRFLERLREGGFR